MNKGLLGKILPHLLAIFIFFIVAVLFNMPAIQGEVLGDQHDILGWQGVAQNAYDYKAVHGHYPLWNTNVFSGMPNYLIIMDGKGIIPNLHAILGLGLPQPANFFFIAALCFYILCMAFGVKRWIGILGGLAYAFATYNPIIISAGHVTKMFAISYMPLLLAGMILTYERKYWLGLAVTTLGSFMLVVSNHPQISFYFLIVAVAVTIGYIVSWILKKQWKHIGIALGITAVAAAVGVAGNAISLLTTAEYSKASIRGGKTVDIKGEQVTTVKTAGLDTNYAMAYSLGKGEVATVIMPNAYGGNGRERVGTDSKAIENLESRGVPRPSAEQVVTNMSRFWGESDSTAGGPVYSGAIICVLALLGFVLYKKPLRWALLAVSILAVMMAWGRHLAGFNIFLFEHLPLYNKFRSPSITMVIVQFTLPIMAVLGLNYILYRDNAQELLKADFKKILYALGGLTVLLGIMYLMADYSSAMDQEIIANKWDQSGTDEIGRTIVAGLKSDRKSLYGLQVLRTIGFMLLVLGTLWLFMKKMINGLVVIIILAFVNTIDLLVIDRTYLDNEKYEPKYEQAQTIAPNNIDNEILKDKGIYRVYYLAPDRFSSSDYHVSALHKSIGGYHPAKIRIYQDIMERYLYGGYSPEILNMLNVKYVITQNQQNGQLAYTVNPTAFGPAWLVRSVKIAKDDLEAIQSLGTTNLKDTAIVTQEFANLVTQPVPDSLSTIAVTKFDNDEIEYTADCQGPQFAVFSEVYYPYGWNAYIDGQPAKYVRADYTLRGMSIPAGKHTIKFVFEPSSYKKGSTIAFISSFLFVILVLGGFFMAWRKSRRSTVNK